MNYQGKLTDAGGNPLANGTYGVAFRIWNKKTATDTGNQLIWGQEYNVAVQNGVFNVILGANGGDVITNAAVNDLNFAFGESERFLGMTITRNANGPIGNPSEIQPRQQIFSAPYAIRASSAMFADVSTLAINGVPPGVPLPFCGSTIPSGFLLCDGRAVGRTNYAALFNAIGTNYGEGDGSATFNLPDFRGRALIGSGVGGVDAVGRSLTARTLGQIGGEEIHQLTIAEMPSHKHYSFGENISNWPQGTLGPNNNQGPDSADQDNYLLGTTSAGGDQPHNIMQPFAVVNYIIKY
jgi:microcystin-dependent protein